MTLALWSGRRVRRSHLTLRSHLVVAACALSALALHATPAFAQIGSGNTIYACFRTDRDGDEGKITRVVAATEACKKNEINL